MSSMTAYQIDPATWTLVHTAALDGPITIQNLATDSGLRVRIGASVATTDAMTDPYHMLQPMESRRFGDIKTGDKVLIGIDRAAASTDASKVNAVVWK